jgi:hypothetical protein
MITQFARCLLGAAFLGSLVVGQNGAPMAFTSIGTPQPVPPPVGVSGETGNMDMVGWWVNTFPVTRRLTLNVRYVPQSYTTTGAESFTLAMQVGSSSLPGIPFEGAQVYLPLGPGLILQPLGGTRWNGPGNTSTPTSTGGTGQFCPFTNSTECVYGNTFTSTIPLTLSNVPITAQYFMTDPARNRTYSSNALNMVAP